MRKKREILEYSSCLNRAGLDEMIFVLLGRDPAAPAAIRAWCLERIKLNKNHTNDRQISEALECAEIMEKECKTW